MHMARIAKKYAEAIKKVDREKRYDLDEALELLPKSFLQNSTRQLSLRFGSVLIHDMPIRW